MTQIKFKQPYLLESFFDNFREQVSYSYKSLMIDDLGCQGPRHSAIEFVHVIEDDMIIMEAYWCHGVQKIGIS